MAKFSNDNNLDVLLNRLKNNSVQAALCNGQPASYGEATTNKGSTVPGGGTARRLGNSTGNSTSFFTGPSDSTATGAGRKLVINSIAGMTIDITSTGANHLAFITSSTASELLFVTTITTPQDVISGNTADFSAFNYTVQDIT